MKELDERIINEGKVIMPDILKVDSFLNHQMDVALFEKIGAEFARRFKDEAINKILTIESSGIGIAVMAARYFGHCPVVFVKKNASRLVNGDVYQTKIHSFTKDQDYQATVAKNYLNEEDHVLIIDDFLANGEAVSGMIALCQQAKADVHGVGIVIEKGFQQGRQRILRQGVRLESLAVIDRFEDGQVILRKDETCI